FEVSPRRLLVRGRPVVEGDREALVLDGPVGGRDDGLELAAPARGLWMALEPVAADHRNLVQPGNSTRVLSRPAGYERDERVARGEPDELAARVVRDRGVLGHRDDRGQRTVDVEQDRRPSGLRP